jgi:2-iminobutanoate/2-iminopropanoate deaminase
MIRRTIRLPTPGSDRASPRGCAGACSRPANCRSPSGDLVSDDVGRAARQALENVRAILAAGGASLKDVVKVTVYLTDMAQFAAVNEVYGQFFSEPYPARTCIAVAGLPRGALLEIEAQAVVQ